MSRKISPLTCGFPGECKAATALVCAACKSVRYCSAAHQKVAWKASHKIECSLLREALKADGPGWAKTASEGADASKSESPPSGADVTVAYAGRFANGVTFDSSDDFTFGLGRQEVIRGWDLCVAGMKLGEKTTVALSPSLAYGEFGTGPIPGNTPLVFDITLHSWKTAEGETKALS